MYCIVKAFHRKALEIIFETMNEQVIDEVKDFERQDKGLIVK